MRKVTALLVTGMLSVAGLTATAAPAQACVGVKCTVDCVKRIVSGSRVCPD